MCAFMKPIIKKEVSLGLSNLRIVLQAVPKFGKTTTFAKLVLEEYGDPAKGLLIGVGNEYGYSLIDNLQVSHCTTFAEMLELKKWLIEGKVKGEHEIQLIGVDTVDELIPMVEDYVCKLSEKETRKPCPSINASFGGLV